MSNPVALVDSVEAFKARCDEAHDELFTKLQEKDIETYSTLAFSLGSPQNNVNEAEFERLATEIFGPDASLGMQGILRRIHFEATTILLADMKQQVANSDASEPIRKLPFIEKQTRLDSQKTRLSGLLLNSDQQPCHQLIDTVFGMLESGSITYIGPSRCHSREFEIQSEAKSKSKSIFTIEQGSLKSTQTSTLDDIDTSTELKLYFALQRRHLAFELVNFLSWSLCQLWLDKLMSKLVMDMPGDFHSYSMQQILRADREIFSLLASEHRGKIRSSGGKPPLDATFEQLMNDPRVNVHLITYPKAAVHSTANKRKHEHGETSSPPKKQKHGPPVKPSSPSKPGPKISSMPDELKGLATKTPDGKPMCWHRNLAKGCRNPVKNGRCKFGFHQCMVCFSRDHGASECPKKQ